jgi:D-glutamate cyclase
VTIPTTAHALGDLGRAIDAIVSTDYTARKLSPHLYEAAVDRLGEPLAMKAACELAQRVHPGDIVAICTGWPSRSWLMKGLTETDGPVGAAYLARVVEQCLGAVPVYVTHPDLARYGSVGLGSAGLIVTDLETAVLAKQGAHRASAAAVLGLSADWDEARTQARELLDSHSVGAVIAVEMPGANANQEFHNVTGRLVPTELVAKADALIQEARDRGILTIGVGDGGNELGMGYIKDRLGEILDCDPAWAPATDVDVLVVGVVSNFAAVALGAAVAAVAGRPGVLRTVDIARITERLSDAGAIDGLTAYVDPKNDGMSRAATAAIIELVTTAVEQHLEGWNKG